MDAYVVVHGANGITAAAVVDGIGDDEDVRLVVASDHRAVLRPLRISQLDSVLTVVGAVADALTRLDRHDDLA